MIGGGGTSREKVIWKMFTENDCYTFADLEGNADLRKVVMDKVLAQDVSWASEKGTKRLTRLPMSLMRA